MSLFQTHDSLCALMDEMSTDKITNYAMAGLQSTLFGSGLVRMFHQKTHALSMISPHSHRYDLGCMVLHGEVQNTIWTEADKDSDEQEFRVTELHYQNMPGDHTAGGHWNQRYRFSKNLYTSGDVYFMQSDVVHSIKFSRGTRVLVFEGPPVSLINIVLDPVVPDGGPVPLSNTQPWMFVGARKNEDDRK